MSFLLRLCCGLVVASSLAHVAHAWVSKDYQAFPNGKAPIIVDPFCKIEDCVFSKEKWKSIVFRAITEWNNAKTGFTFLPLAESPSDDPCHTYDVVSIILSDGENVCPEDQSFSPILTNGYAILRKYKSRVYINIEGIAQNFGGPQEDSIIALLMHELGHVIGLGHPDEAGQQVTALMNSFFHPLRELQPR